MGVGAVVGFHGAACIGVEVGNIFGDDDALPSMNTDYPWVKIAVMVAGCLKSFNGALHCTTILCPVVGTVGE